MKMLLPKRYIITNVYNIIDDIEILCPWGKIHGWVFEENIELDMVKCFFFPMKSGNLW